MLTNRDIVELTAFRRELHQHPEVSGDEAWTAATITKALGALSPDMLVTGLGGHGVAAVWSGAEAGPTVMFRCELDALPIDDESGADWASKLAGRGHQCGHDGHMSVLMGLARLIARQKPGKGRVVLLFQPAEEDGSGAAAVLADPKFAQMKPDWAFSLHNMPGFETGAMVLAAGPANCASRGLKIALAGHTSHASSPEFALSPAMTLARLIPAVMAEGPGGELDENFRLVTVTHARLGEPAFGITPGYGELWVTLRTLTDAAMEDLLARITHLAETEAAALGLRCTLSHHDIFHACHNDPEATEIFIKAAQETGVSHLAESEPMRASEDFGLFGSQGGAKSAMFRLGSGVTHPKLHNPDYDFPDEIMPIGVKIFDRVLRDLLG